jgi:hypothetical protein
MAVTATVVRDPSLVSIVMLKLVVSCSVRSVVMRAENRFMSHSWIHYGISLW